MRYGFGKAFILSEQRVNGSNLKDLQWFPTMPTDLNDRAAKVDP